MEDPRALLQRYNIAPRKSLGQNFLVATSAPSRIAEQADLTAVDTVLEIGAGVGTLTSALAARAGRVVAVETDPELVTVLSQEFAEQKNVKIVHGDILALSVPDLLDMTPGSDARPRWGTRRPHYKVVANLPYYITAAVIRHILEAPIRPAQLVVTVQHEVAKRITARPGDLSVLAVGVQFYGKPRICFRLGTRRFLSGAQGQFGRCPRRSLRRAAGYDARGRVRRRALLHRGARGLRPSAKAVAQHTERLPAPRFARGRGGVRCGGHRLATPRPDPHAGGVGHRDPGVGAADEMT